jgi:hypothetical protein
LTHDGQRLLLREAANNSHPSVRIIVNWLESATK